MGYWLAFCIFRFERYRLHPDNFDATIAFILGLLSGGVWLFSTPGYLRKLGLSRIWMTALVAPYVVSVTALWNGWNVIGWAALIVGVLAQFGLGFIQPKTDP